MTEQITEQITESFKKNLAWFLDSYGKNSSEASASLVFDIEVMRRSMLKSLSAVSSNFKTPIKKNRKQRRKEQSYARKTNRTKRKRLSRYR